MSNDQQITIQSVLLVSGFVHPFQPTERPHLRLSSDDCLENKREDYQNCSVQYSVFSTACHSCAQLQVHSLQHFQAQTENVFV